jgi:hypothetical protein
MILCVKNYLETAVITPNLGLTAYPPENLFSDTNFGEDGVCAYTGSIVIDLGSAKHVDTIGYLRASSALVIEANSADSWTSPAYTLSLTEKITEINQTYRYWRITTVAIGKQFIGTFYLGEALKPTIINAGTMPVEIYNDRRNKSGTGKITSNYGIILKTESFNVTACNITEYEKWTSFVHDVTEHTKAIIFCRFEETQTVATYLPYLAVVNFQTESRNIETSINFNFTVEEVR